MAKIVMTMLELEKMIQVHLGMTGMKILEDNVVEFDFLPAAIPHMKEAEATQKKIETEHSGRFSRGLWSIDMKTDSMRRTLDHFSDTGEYRLIELIKEVRNQTGSGLAEAKFFVDSYKEDMGREYKKFKLLEEIQKMGGN